MLRVIKKTVVFFALGIALVFSIGDKPVYADATFFNAPEIYSPDITPFYKWTRLLVRMDKRSQLLQPWLDNRKVLEALSPGEAARKVNDLVNNYDYVADMVNWGTDNYWETPTEFFARGGDCEDFAIAKYAWLSFLGVPEERLRIAIVHDRIRNIPHAVLILYINGKAMILDNQVREIRDGSTTNRYRLLYSINRLGWWLPAGERNNKIGTLATVDQIEPASGGDDIQFSRKCLAGISLPECINAIEPD